MTVDWELLPPRHPLTKPVILDAMAEGDKPGHATYVPGHDSSQEFLGSMA